MFDWNFIPCGVLMSITISTIRYIASITLYSVISALPIICKEQCKNKLTLCLTLKLPGETATEAFCVYV